MPVSQFERFKTAAIPRKRVKNAPYNPRTIGKKERQRLTEGLTELGLVAPLVWNERTGNLVSGHQRISILDELEGSQDYRLTVARVDVTPAQEKKLNLLLNNAKAQGRWDDEKLCALITDLNGELKGSGFDAEDFDRTIRGIEGEVKEQWEIVIQCRDEKEQTKLLTRFEKEGLKCRALIS